MAPQLGLLPILSPFEKVYYEDFQEHPGYSGFHKKQGFQVPPSLTVQWESQPHIQIH